MTTVSPREPEGALSSELPRRQFSVNIFLNDPSRLSTSQCQLRAALLPEKMTGRSCQRVLSTGFILVPAYFLVQIIQHRDYSVSCFCASIFLDYLSVIQADLAITDNYGM